MSSTLRLAAIAFVLMAACVGDEPGPELGEAELADTVPAPTWDMPSCDGTATGLVITPTTTTCAGSWEYFGWNKCRIQCGVGCGARQTCARFVHGIEAGAETVTRRDIDVDCTWQCSSSFCALSCPDLDPCRENDRVTDERTLESSIIKQIDREVAELDLDLDAGERAAMDAKVRSLTKITISTTELGPPSPDWGRAQDGDTYTRQFRCTRREVKAVAQSKAGSAHCPCTMPLPTYCYRRCGPIESTRRYTTPGAARPQDTPQTLDVDTARPITCMTCDDKAPVDDKFTCLTEKLGRTLVPAELEGTGVTQATFRNSIVARLKLLYEFYGRDVDTRLSPAQVDVIRPLYAAEAGKAACHLPFATLSATCKQQGRDTGISQRLQFCTNNLTYPAGMQQVRTAEMDYCLGTFALVPTVTNATCKQKFLELTTTMARDVVNSEFQKSGWYGIRMVNDQLQGLPEAFAALDMWWENARLAGQGDEWVRSEMNAVVSGFWTHVHKASSLPIESSARATAGNENSSNAQLQTALDGLSDRGLATDLAVLDKLFTSSINSPPMLLVAGTALRPLVERAETLSEMHDLVCRFRDCAPSSATRIGDLWRILSRLHDRESLSSAVDGAHRLREARADVWNVFDKLRLNANYRKLNAAYTSALADEHGNPSERSIGHLVNSSGVQPGAAATLVQVVDLAGKRWINFEKTQQFLGAGARALHAGIQDKTMITRQLGVYVDALRDEYDDFVADRRSMVLGLLDEITAGTNLGAVEARSRRLIADLDDARSRLAELYAAEGDAAVQLADFPARFEDLRKQGQFGNDMNAQTATIGTLKLSAANAREASSQGRAVDFAATYVASEHAPPQVWTHRVTTGEMVHLAVDSKTWSPTCALRGASLRHPANGQQYGISLATASTGPEGYSVSFSQGTFSSSAFSWDAGFREYANTETCAQAGGHNGITQVFGAEVKAWVRACAGLEFSASQRWSGSNGEDQRTNASFSGGIRLKNTPYPDAPAGALLLVAVRPGSTQPFDVQVVTRQSSWLATEDADVYLVVNDLASCPDDSTDALTVNVYKTTPMGAVAKTLGVAMAKALEKLEADAPAIIAQGQLFANVDTALKASARQFVKAPPYNIDVTQLPPLVRDFFEMHLALRLASVERRAAIARVEHGIAQTDLEREAMEYEVHGAQSAYPLTQLLTRWQLRELERNELYLHERQLVAFLRNYVAPALELRFPHTLEELLGSADEAKSVVRQLDQLEDLDFGAANDEIASHLLALGRKMHARIEEAAIGDSIDPDLPLIGVSFPDPECYKRSDAAIPGRCVCNPAFQSCPDEVGDPPPTSFPAVPYDLAVAAWKGLAGGGEGKFEIRAEDLYARTGGTKLLCEQSAPIIRRMAVMFVSRSEQSPIRNDLNLPLRPSKQAQFPTADGLLRFTLGGGWVNPLIPGLGTVEYGEAATFNASRRVVGTGLSPFGVFRVGLDAVRAHQPIDDLAEMVVLFQVDYRAIAPPGVNLPICR
jgi:hypothetical protein